MKNYLDFSGLSLYNDLVQQELTNFANEALTSEDFDNILKYGQKEVIEASSVEGFPEEGDSDYIYVNSTTGDTYKWESNDYVLDNTLINVSKFQSNWNETSTKSNQYIQNKPTILTNNEILALFDGTVSVSGSPTFAYLGTSSGTAFSASFDPQTDTVWNKPQVLTAAQKAQVKQNLGISDGTEIVFNTTYDATTNKAATMADIPASLPANGGNSATVNNHTVAADVPSDAVFTDTTYSSATQSTAGLMSATDKTKLDNLNITISSSNPTSQDGSDGDIWLVYDAS